MSLETCLVQDSKHDKGAVSPPIYQTSLFEFDSYNDLIERFKGDNEYPLYSRVDNPTVKEFQDKMAALEQTEDAIAFSSGMAAISNTIIGLTQPKDRILCVNHVYPDAYRFMRGIAARFGILAEFVNGTNLDSIEDKLPGCKLLYLESPSSWVMEEQDLTAIAALAKRYGVITVIDNTCATPIFQKPTTLGIDVVIHSASKYINGHSDVVAGVVLSRSDIIDDLKRNVCVYLGNKLSAHEAGLILRGLRTLPLRMARHQDSALILAKRLQEHKSINRIFHPLMNRKSFSTLKGSGGLFSIEVTEDINIETFCDSLRLFKLGVSWGGYESLVLPVAPSIQQDTDTNPSLDFNVPPRLIRLFVGLEDPQDLWLDLENALLQSEIG